MISRIEFSDVFRRGHRLSTALAGMAALAVATLGFAQVAGAAGTAPVKPPAGLHSSAIPFGASASTYFAGYRATPVGGLASASVTFTVPAISCTANDKADDANGWTGIYTDTNNTYAFIDGYCTSSGPAYNYVVKTEGGSVDQAGAAAGDVVVASLFQSASSTYAEIHDLTANVNYLADNSVNQGDSVVDIGTFNQVANNHPIPTFTKIKFTSATVNGDYLGFDSPTEFNALNGGDLLIKTGKLATTATGSGFSEAFKHAS